MSTICCECGPTAHTNIYKCVQGNIMMLCGDISAQLLQKWSLAGAHHHFCAIISEMCACHAAVQAWVEARKYIWRSNLASNVHLSSTRTTVNHPSSILETFLVCTCILEPAHNEIIPTASITCSCSSLHLELRY